MPNMSWEGRRAEDFASLVESIPDETLKSPRRSVVPLVDLFRVPQRGLALLQETLGIPAGTATELAFESPLPVQRGTGKASYTDLLILGPTVSAAIEAKFTEPRYETVQDWLGDAPSPNRVAVLDGWLAIIASLVGSPISSEAVNQLPYQLVHRAASACAPKVQSRALIYLVFGTETAPYYAEDLARFDELLGMPEALSIYVVGVPLTGSSALNSLLDRWDAGQRNLAPDVRDVLMREPVFTFGAPTVHYARGESAAV